MNAPSDDKQPLVFAGNAQFRGQNAPRLYLKWTIFERTCKSSLEYGKATPRITLLESASCVSTESN